MVKKIALLSALVILTGAGYVFAGLACHGEKINAGNKVCPVTGQTIDAEKMKPASVEHGGKVYNLCCAGCIEEFKKDPDRFIAQMEKALKDAE